MRWLILVGGAILVAGCGGDDGGGTTPTPCGGLCPANECFGGMCVGGNNGADAGDGGDDAADLADGADLPDDRGDVPMDVDVDDVDDVDSPDGDDIGDGGDTADAPDSPDVPPVCIDADDCDDGEICEDGQCVEACVADDREPDNDADAEAVAVGPGARLELQALTACPGDEDWYPVELERVGEQISASLVQAGPAPALVLEILGTDAQTVLAVAPGEEGLRRNTSATSNAPGTYFVRVTTPDGLRTGGLGYSLALTRTDPDGCAPDGFEPNDAADAAAPLGRGSQDARLCRSDGDSDWYRVDVALGDQVDITLDYDHALIAPNAELGAVVYGPGGVDDVRDFLVRDRNTSTDRLASGPFTAGRSDEGTWLLEVDSLTDGGPVDYTIDLSVEGGEMSCGVEDPSEPNDTCPTAAPLPTFTSVEGYICGPDQDEDWFSVQVGGGDDLTVRVEHFHFEGNVELEVYDPDNGLAGLSFNAGPNYEEVTVENAAAGTYCARIFVRSSLTQNNYAVSAQTR